MITDSSVEFLRAKIKADTFTDAESSSSRNPVVAKIKRVPEHLREGMPGAYQYFDPTLLYLGPFHWGKVIPEESKRLKKKIATVFMKCIGDLDKSTIMCETIYDKFDNLMNFYEPVAGEKEGSSKSKEKQEQQTRTWKEESACMLFEDGCAILYFICRKDQCFIDLSANVPVLIDDDDPRIATDILKLENQIPIDAPGIATEDILKLENQIPYRVLTLLMESTFGDRVPWRNTIDNFIAFQIMRITPSAQNQDEVSASRLVGLQTTLPPAEDVELEAQQSSPSRSHHHVLQTPSSSSLAAPVHLLQHLRERLVGILPSRVSASSRTPSLFTAYSSDLMSEFSGSYNGAATSLKSRNIKIKAVHFKNNLSNISCDLRYRRVNIPSIAISKSSKSILMNLAADEVSSDIPNSLEISSFLHFLDKLVYSPEDAKVLREAKVICNSISNDEEAAAFLNDTAALLPTNAKLFEKAEKNIQDLLENYKYKSMHKLMLQLVNQYFSSPWAVIAFVGGMLVLSLTMLQTYVTIFPVPEELVKNVNQWKVISYLMKRMFTAVLLPLPLLLTLLCILRLTAVALALSSNVPKSIRQRLAFTVPIGFAVEFAFSGFGIYAVYLQFHKFS